MNAQILGREFHRRKKAGEGGGCRHHLGHAGRLAGNVAKRIGIPHAPLLDMKAIPVEHCQHAIADVGGEDMQQRLFGQLKKPAVAVEKPAVVALQQGIGGEAGRFPAGELGSQPKGIEEREPADDPVAHIKLRHRDDLGGRLCKLLVAAGIALPVEHQMSRQHASPRHRGDIGYQRQRAVVAQVAQHPQMVERGPEAAAGKCQTKTCHGGLITCRWREWVAACHPATTICRSLICRLMANFAAAASPQHSAARTSAGRACRNGGRRLWQ